MWAAAPRAFDHSRLPLACSRFCCHLSEAPPPHDVDPSPMSQSAAGNAHTQKRTRKKHLQAKESTRGRWLCRPGGAVSTASSGPSALEHCCSAPPYHCTTRTPAWHPHAEGNTCRSSYSRPWRPAKSGAARPRQCCRRRPNRGRTLH